ncbi:MAG: alpha/beta hydrolase, partial [Candidatus Aminicenantes bacterium]|nr:alpha/beta hydrolase [Candidatus Aminicenantes bacterium]
MIDRNTLEFLRKVSPAESERFQAFLSSHEERRLEADGRTIPYYACGAGRKTLLTFAGGWGGIELAYETVLGFEPRNRVVVVDVSAFDDPETMGRGVNRVLDAEGVGRVVVVGQSLSGIIGQSYFKRHYRLVDGLVLTNTPAPRKERSKKWALLLLKLLPLGWLKPLIRRKMTRLGELKADLAPEVLERRRFAMALIGCMVDTYWTKKNMLNIFKLAFAFNERDGYSMDSFPGWRGKALIVTSPDDPYHQDVGLLLKNLPNAEKYEFPPGFGHMAPQIHRDLFHRVIQEF